jgi:hypothetical protein
LDIATAALTSAKDVRMIQRVMQGPIPFLILLGDGVDLAMVQEPLMDN